MAVREIEIRARTSLAGGQAFGDIGPYERIDGIAHFAVDPAHPANQAIADLDRTARDAAGQVRFAADFCLLQPADPARGNGRLLFDVLNRGRKIALSIFNRAPRALVPTEEIDPGDGLLMRLGWTVVWCGWQWDVVRSNVLMGLDAPQALGPDGQPLAGQVIVEFQPVDRDRDRLLADRVHQPYPVADVNDPDAVLTVRETFDGPRSVVPRDRWRFARDENGQAAPDDTRVRLEGGFEPGHIYEVIYRTRICPVVGTGLLAVRDTTAFLRHGQDGNPSAGRIRHTYAFGMSQSGRFLRHFLYLGLNQDEAGRQVYDGIVPHVAGARRGEFNHRYGQPSVQSTRNFGHLFPFTWNPEKDPLTGQIAGLLDRQRALGGVPKIIETNTSAEYWRGDCSLIHTDPAGRYDLELPDEARIYHLAGTQHVSGSLPQDTVGPDGSRGANPSNVVDYTPLMRALLLHLDRWVVEGVDPPPSVVPRLADRTLAPAAEIFEKFPRVPGLAVPDADKVWLMPRVHLGPNAAEGVGVYPAKTGDPYPAYMPANDADGNERGGLRLPDLTVPIATHTGWNPRAAGTGGPGQLILMMGSSVPFARTAAERLDKGDPRSSVDELYADREHYLSRVRLAAQDLAGQGYLLPDDVEVVVDNSRVRWNTFFGDR